MKKVLIADDNRIALEGMKKVIDWKSFDCELVAFCTNGEEVWDIIQKEPIDIVITDVEMPKMNGITLLEKINEHKPEIKLIFMSCYEDFNFVKSAIDMNAIAYVLKPVIPEQLEEALTKIMNIYKAKSTLMESQHELDNLIESHLDILQDHFFRSLPFSPQITEDEILAKLKSLSIDIAAPYTLQTAVIQTSSYSCTSNEFLLELLDMQRFIASVNIPDSVIKSYLDSNDSLLVIFIYSPSQTDNINNIYIRLNEYALSNHMKVKIGISNESDKLSDFSELYMQAKQAISSSFISDKNALILYGDILSDTECVTDFIDPTILRQELSNLLFNQEDVDINAFLNNYIPTNIEKMHEYYIRYFCYSTINIVEMLLSSFKINFNEVVNHSIIWSKLAQYESITDVKQWLFNILRSTREIIYKNTLKKDSELVDKIKKIIEQDYASHLTLNNISEKLFFSSIHINNIFKKETGLTISEYLTKHRISIAKKLLADPDSKMYAVAKSVGYKNQSHFKLLFKQMTGYTPTEYKTMVTKEHKN